MPHNLHSLFQIIHGLTVVEREDTNSRQLEHRLASSKASNSLSPFKGNKIGDSGKIVKKNPSSLLGCTSDFTDSIPTRFRMQKKVPRRPRNGNCGSSN